MSITPTWQGVAVYTPGATYGPRTVDFHEFIWILRGGMTWTVDGRPIVLGEGDVALIRPGAEESYHWSDRGLNTHGYLCFTATGLPAGAAWPWVRPSGSTPLLIPLLEQAAGWMRHRPEGWEPLAASAIALAVQAFLAPPMPRSDPLGALDPRVGSALAAALRQWRDLGLRNLPVTTLARAAGVSVPQLTRLFRNAFGEGPAAVLRALRLQRAGVMLVRSTLPLDDVAQATGFTDAFHLSRHFRRRYGMPPGRWRDLARNDRAPQGPAVIRALGDHLWA